MFNRIRATVQDVASYIWSLPPSVRYPIIGLLVVAIPGISVAIAVGGGSLTVALSPVIIAYGIVWYLANRGR